MRRCARSRRSSTSCASKGSTTTGETALSSAFRRVSESDALVVLNSLHVVDEGKAERTRVGECVRTACDQDLSVIEGQQRVPTPDGSAEAIHGRLHVLVHLPSHSGVGGRCESGVRYFLCRMCRLRPGCPNVAATSPCSLSTLFQTLLAWPIFNFTSSEYVGPRVVPTGSREYGSSPGRKDR